MSRQRVTSVQRTKAKKHVCGNESSRECPVLIGVILEPKNYDGTSVSLTNLFGIQWWFDPVQRLFWTVLTFQRFEE